MCFGLEKKFLSRKEPIVSVFEKFDHIVREKFIL